MSVVVAWLLFPAVALLVLWGCGLLVERAAGAPLPAGALLGLGMCVVIVASWIAVQSSATARLAAPVVVLLAVAGFVLSRRTLRRRVDPWGAAAACGAFVVYALPVVLTGQATFAGYTVLGDTAVQFLAADHLLHHGFDISMLGPSDYRAALHDYFVAGGYPPGTQLAAGALRALVPVDIAWVYQPFLALLGLLLAAAFWTLAGEWVASRPLRALVAFVAAQPALLYAYALQGSVKEIGTVWIIVLLAALLPWWRAACGGGPRRVIPLALASAASIAILGFAIAPWLAPILVLAALVALTSGRLRGRPLLVSVAAFAGLTALLALPASRTATAFSTVTTAVVTGKQEYGNLLGDLNRLQVFGTWLTGDYRIPPQPTDLIWSHVLIGVTAAALIVAAGWAIREARWLLLGLAAVGAVACLYVVSKGSPWADGKALAITAPLVLFAALLGAAAVARRMPVAGWGLALAIAAGVLVSNALAYHAAVPAPRDRLAELSAIGDRFAGRGPALLPDQDDFAKHFARRIDPQGTGAQTDVDALGPKGLARFPLIVRRASPVASRPPANYRLVRRGRWYEVWQRDPAGPDVLRHVPLGTASSAAAVPRCATVRRLAARARLQGGQVAGAPRAPSAVFRSASVTPLPAKWVVDPNETDAVDTPAPGRLRGTISVPRTGRYRMFLEGTFGRAVVVSIDGRRVARVRRQANYRSQSEPLGPVDLPAGRHTIEILRGGGEPWPGTSGIGWRIGRFWLDPAPAAPPVVRVAPERAAAAFCGRPLDWIAVVR